MKPLVTGVLLLGLLLVGVPARAEEPFLEDTGHRFRWGLSAGVGSALGRGGVAMKGELRLGYQLSRRFSLFGLLAAGGSFSVLYGGQADFGAVAEFTLVDWFYFGGGLVASYGTTNVNLNQGDYLSYSYASDPIGGSFRPALDLRLGFSTGASRPPWFSRGGFNIGVHALLMLHPNMTVTTYTSSSGPSIAPYPAQVIVTPMVTIGFDSR